MFTIIGNNFTFYAFWAEIALKFMDTKIILGIETSCDDTSAGLVNADREVLSNVVASQVDLHTRYGGIVPEIASRQHIIDIRPVVNEALRIAGVNLDDVAAVAVTYGPGLAGSLLVGINFAKGLVAATGKPLIAVNHLEGHFSATWAINDKYGGAETKILKDLINRQIPILGLLVSGGHTELVIINNPLDFVLIGETRDDAAGEAFDKVARILGLRYPGGPEIERVAETVDETFSLPRAWLRGTDDFSFSGLKTAVLTRARKDGIYPSDCSSRDPVLVAKLAKAFQESVIDVLVTKTMDAASRVGSGAIILAGGVAANGPLREELTRRSNLPVLIPPVSLCTDNGAMIALSGLARFETGQSTSFDLDVQPDLRLGA